VADNEASTEGYRRRERERVFSKERERLLPRRLAKRFLHAGCGNAKALVCGFCTGKEEGPAQKQGLI
jgi:hypothetical protein